MPQFTESSLDNLVEILNVAQAQIYENAVKVELSDGSFDIDKASHDMYMRIEHMREELFDYYGSLESRG